MLVKNNSNDSILELMDRAYTAALTGALTAAEFMELNSLANRLKFATDFNEPSFVPDRERIRFADLCRKATARQPACACEDRIERSAMTGGRRTS